MLEISLIVPSQNHATAMKRLFPLLALQTLDSAQWELIVVDKSSTDSTRSIVKQQGSAIDLTLVTLDSRCASASLARRVGLQCAMAPVVVFLDPTVMPTPNFLRAHLRHVVEFRAVSLGYTVPVSNLEIRPENPTWTTVPSNNHRDQVASPSRSKWVENVGLPRDLLLRVGLAGERDVSLSFEDAVLTDRLRAEGATFMHNIAAVGVRHH